MRVSALSVLSIVVQLVTWTAVCHAVPTDPLLMSARRLRDDHGDNSVSRAASARYYKAVIDRAEGATQVDALRELYELLEAHPQTPSAISSFELLTRSAELGDPHAQHLLAVSLASGIHGATQVPVDPLKAVVLEFASALSGNADAALAMGYRYMSGIGVKMSCAHALPFYELAAHSAVNSSRGYWDLKAIDFSHLNELVENQDPVNTFSEELMDYTIEQARADDPMSALTAGLVYLTGSRFIDANETLAIEFLEIAAAKNETVACGLVAYLRVMQTIKRSKSGSLKEGVSKNEQKFFNKLFRSHVMVGLVAGEVHANLAAALMTRHGLLGHQNNSAAAQQLNKFLTKHRDAGFHMADVLEELSEEKNVARDMSSSSEQHLELKKTSDELSRSRVTRGEQRTRQRAAIVAALSQSQMAGHIEATYRLALLEKDTNCIAAVDKFKFVAERSEAVSRLKIQAMRKAVSSNNNDRLNALWMFVRLAALGIESAQFNAAYLLHEQSICPPLLAPQKLSFKVTDAQKPNSDILRNESASTAAMLNWKHLYNSSHLFNEEISSIADAETRRDRRRALEMSHCEAHALMFYALSAAQRNGEALLNMGDMYYQQRSQMTGSKPISTHFYALAAQYRSTQALFNLAWMYQTGDGTTQDFHLAKRYYDMAVEVDPRAAVPRDLALLAMNAQQWLLKLLECSEWSPDTQDTCQWLVQQLQVFVEIAVPVVRSIDQQLQQVLRTWETNTPRALHASSHNSADLNELWQWFHQTTRFSLFDGQTITVFNAEIIEIVVLLALAIVLWLYRSALVRSLARRNAEAAV